MENKGLCITCVKVEDCIFNKEPSVWQCEEFSAGTTEIRKSQAGIKKCVSCEETTEE